jgi:hypothetical protein
MVGFQLGGLEDVSGYPGTVSLPDFVRKLFCDNQLTGNSRIIPLDKLRQRFFALNGVWRVKTS